MTQWSPEWSLTVDGNSNYSNITLSTLTITSGRTDIYSQAVAGYASFEIINLDLSAIAIDVNDQVSIQVKDSTGTYVNVFGGFVTDCEVSVTTSGTGGINEIIRVTALGALSKLPKTLTEGVLSKDYDGDQIFAILSEALFNQWNELPAALTWDSYNATTEWIDAENAGLGEIDRPGNYELHERSANVTDMYSLVSALATSGLGYLYEDASGRIGYADSTHRSVYLGTYGYVTLSGNHASTSNIRTIRRLGDIRNKVTIQYKNNSEVTASDAASIATYGQQAQAIQTSIENTTDAENQADFYLAIRAYPQDVFQGITFPLGNPEIDDSDRDALLNVFMGLPVDIQDLPSNMVDGRFQGFVEGWTFRSSYNDLSITLNVSPTAYSLQAYRWNDVGAAETWNTINPTLDWTSATIVA